MVCIVVQQVTVAFAQIHRQFDVRHHERFIFIGDFAIVAGDHPIWRTLKDGHVCRFLCNFGDELYSTCCGADHADAFSFQRNALVPPC